MTYYLFHALLALGLAVATYAVIDATNIKRSK